PVLASIELAKKASMAKIQGLKPARRPAAKTVATDDMLRSSRAFSVALLAEVIAVFVELSIARANDEIATSATVSKTAMTQSRSTCIMVSLDRSIIEA
ncbi:MAG: hypothetical protein LUQ38_01390, partial [Methanotrichaceae archaeon]|nr:hypothetical protein [Methanotrichaceae archaeon]